MIWRLVSFWNCLFLGATLNFRGVVENVETSPYVVKSNHREMNKSFCIEVVEFSSLQIKSFHKDRDLYMCFTTKCRNKKNVDFKNTVVFSGFAILSPPETPPKHVDYPHFMPLEVLFRTSQTRDIHRKAAVFVHSCLRFGRSTWSPLGGLKEP